MKILDILNAPWAILPEKLLEIREIYLRHSRGEEADIAAIEAALGRPLANDPQPYEIDRGVAIVDVSGVLAKRMDMFMEISGGTSTRTVARNFKAALADPAAHSILLSIDSPGGEVDGTQELSNLIAESRGQKPIIALADGMAASAGYWLASAADKVFAADQTTMLGSIGVIATHVDLTKMNEMRGVKVTQITAGKFKGIGSPHMPLNRESQDVIQGLLDQIYSVFVSDVAAHRGVSVEKVLADMADGRELIGEKAVAAGLADGIASREQIIGELNRRAQGRTGIQTAQNQRVEEKTMANKEIMVGVDVLTAEYIEAREAAALSRGNTEGLAEGAKVERERIQAIEVAGAGMPGHEKLVQELKYDGKTTGSQAAEKILAAEKASRETRLSTMRSEAPKPVPNAPAPAPAGKESDYNPTEIAAKARQYSAEMEHKGIKVSAREATDHVLAEGGFKVGTEPVTAGA